MHAQPLIKVGDVALGLKLSLPEIYLDPEASVMLFNSLFWRISCLCPESGWLTRCITGRIDLHMMLSPLFVQTTLEGLSIPYILCANREGSGKTVWIRRLT